MKWPERLYVVQTSPANGLRLFRDEEAAGEFLLNNRNARAVIYTRPEEPVEQVAEEVPRQVVLTDAPAPTAPFAQAATELAQQVAARELPEVRL